MTGCKYHVDEGLQMFKFEDLETGNIRNAEVFLALLHPSAENKYGQMLKAKRKR